MNPEPWYGVHLVYRYLGAEPRTKTSPNCARTDDQDASIERAEYLSRNNYESDTTVHTRFAMSFFHVHSKVCAGVA